mmetsp:Transcript_70443/g.193304  ORF Transcript_70443/g.193304 Transcript_70443/m.193304 type:complete len:237 (-) Transcript_70443:48-758(-)
MQPERILAGRLRRHEGHLRAEHVLREVGDDERLRGEQRVGRAFWLEPLEVIPIRLGGDGRVRSPLPHVADRQRVLAYQSDLDEHEAARSNRALCGVWPYGRLQLQPRRWQPSLLERQSREPSTLVVRVRPEARLEQDGGARDGELLLDPAVARHQHLRLHKYPRRDLVHGALRRLARRIENHWAAALHQPKAKEQECPVLGGRERRQLPLGEGVDRQHPRLERLEFRCGVGVDGRA